MAMAICDALISIEGKVVELLVKPVGHQFDYVFYRVKYIENLREQVQNLEAQRKDVLDSINAAIRNREEILATGQAGYKGNKIESVMFGPFVGSSPTSSLPSSLPP